MDENRTIRHIGWHDLDKRKFFTIGPTLMIGVRLVIFPPILIKTRLQVQKKHSLYNGTFDAFRKIYRYEGLRGLYKGFATSNLSLISGQIYVSIFEITRSQIPGDETFKSLIAGIAASLIAQTITVPIDIISQKQMMVGHKASSVITKHAYISRTAWSVVVEISKTEGLRGLYKGYIASILTYTPNSGIWWGSYYAFTQFFADVRPSGMPDVFVHGVSGPAASIVASICSNPMDVIRTRLQVEGGKQTMVAAFQTLYNEEGIRGAYKGLTARLTSSIPAGFLLIVTYEFIKKLSKKTDCDVILPC